MNEQYFALFLYSFIISLLTNMAAQARTDFYQYLISNQQKNDVTNNLEITSDRLYRIFQDKFFNQFEEEGVFSQQYFRGALRKTAEIILNAVYKDHPPFLKIQQIIAFVSIMQHIFHNKDFNLPHSVLKRTQIYLHSLIVSENLQNMRSIFDDSRSSSIISNFYHSIYKIACFYRTTKIANNFGIKINTFDFIIYLMKLIIEQKECSLQMYDSKVTFQWIIISFVYFILSFKTDLYKQKPVLAKILQKYRSLHGICECQRQINGDELCHFYNNAFIGIISKLQTKEVERLVDDIKTDLDISSEFVITPIQNQDNTILDNIAFSSSWQP